MGAIELIIYNNNNIQNINIDFINSFMKMKHRGINDTSFTSESSINIENLAKNSSDYNKIKYYLSRSQISNYLQYTFIYGYHRMSITDTSNDASQPFIDPIINMILQDEANKGTIEYKSLKNRPIRKLLCNGEIYNHSIISNKYNFNEYDLSSTCDVEIILPLYIKNSNDLDSSEMGLIKTISELNGDFTFIITENIQTYITSTINAFVVRDFIGIKPLYYIYNTTNFSFYMFVSEIKSIPNFIINNLDYNIIQVPPGSYWSFQNVINGNEIFTKYYDFDNYSDIFTCNINEITSDSLIDIYNNIENILTESTILRYTNTIRDVGFLLSGGFDSSILVSIIIKYIKTLDNNENITLHLFTVSDELGDSEIEYIDIFINFLKTNYTESSTLKFEHHTIYLNDIEIIESDIENIIYHLETYDTITINESIPFYYLFKYIKEKSNVQILLSGDGLDELCGYTEYEDYNNENYQAMSVKVLKNLHLYDLLRTDKISQAFNLELRHPYLDKNFVNYILSIHSKIKRSTIYKNTEEPIEKYIIRKSFNFSLYLPDEILWRRSSCICNSLTNFELRLTNYFNNLISDNNYSSKMNTLIQTPGVNIKTLPKNKQELYYRLVFNKLYPNREYLLPIFWESQFD